MGWENCGAILSACLSNQASPEPPNGGYLGLLPKRYATYILKNEKWACRGLWTG